MVGESEKYNAAHAAHAHYDNLSLAVVSAMIFAAGGAFTIVGEVTDGKWKLLIFLSAIPILITLQIIYYYLATFAGVARSVAADIEKLGDKAPAISTVYIDAELYKKYRRNKDLLYYSILIMNVLLCIGMSLSACFIAT